MFSNLIDKAIKMDGILDIANPKYIAEISYSDKQETIYFNIVEEKGNYSGMFIKKGKTEEGYIFRKEDMEEFMKEYKEFLSINEDLTSNSESNEITIKNREWIYRIK